MNRLIWDFRLRRLTCLTYPESDPGNDIVQCAQLGRLSNPVLITFKPFIVKLAKNGFHTLFLVVHMANLFMGLKTAFHFILIQEKCLFHNYGMN